jgi:hypothetical protein
LRYAAVGMPLHAIDVEIRRAAHPGFMGNDVIVATGVRVGRTPGRGGGRGTARRTPARALLGTAGGVDGNRPRPAARGLAAWARNLGLGPEPGLRPASGRPRVGSGEAVSTRHSLEQALCACHAGCGMRRHPDGQAWEFSLVRTPGLRFPWTTATVGTRVKLCAQHQKKSQDG